MEAAPFCADSFSAERNVTVLGEVDMTEGLELENLTSATERQQKRIKIEDVLAQYDVLPDDPDQAISGRALIQRIRELPIETKRWSDSYLGLTFSRLVQLETSPIAKRAGRNGYYRRGSEDESAGIGSDPADTSSTASSPTAFRPRAEEPEEIFRKIFMLWCENQQEQQYPVHIEHVNARRGITGQHRWKFPDVVSVKWSKIDNDERGRKKINKTILKIRSHLGEKAFKYISSELKVEAKINSVREYFFQCVSNSRWAHKAQLVFASDVIDQVVEDELKRLGKSYGVSILTFSLSHDDLVRNIKSAESILCFSDVEEKLQREIVVSVVYDAKEREFIDFDHLVDLEAQHSVFSDISKWIVKSIDEGKPYSFEEWRKEYG